MNIEFANRLIALRKEKGLSQEQLADKLGVSRQAISKWENGESAPDTDNLIALADIYGISLDELLGKKGAPKVEVAEGDVIDPEEKEDDYDDDDNGSFFTGLRPVGPTRLGFAIKMVGGVGTLLSVVAYLLMGFLWQGPSGNLGWACGWTVLLVPGLIVSLLKAIQWHRPSFFQIALLVVIVYVGGGIIGNAYGLNLWHPYWVEFFLIPVYHVFTSMIENRKTK